MVDVLFVRLGKVRRSRYRTDDAAAKNGRAVREPMGSLTEDGETAGRGAILSAMPVLESVVVQVVQETSEQMKDPQFAQVAVGHFVQTQPDLASYLSGRAARLGGATGVVELVFHAELLSECLRRAHGRALPRVPLRTLERAAKGDVSATFTTTEPALASYVASNVAQEGSRLELCRICMALVLGLGAPASAR